MLKSLRIDNFVLIDRVEIDLHKGFTVVTGETGSGKSILLNALNLLLGERADFSVIGPRKDKAIVEGEIDVSSFDLKDFFTKNDLDYFEKTILRREIYKQGRSRAFINDTPVGLNQLKEFASGLIHIHSQYNTLDLKSKNYQLYVLDVLTDNLSLRKEHAALYKDWMNTKRELEAQKNRFKTLLATKDYNDFQLNELLDLEIDNRNYTEIEERLEKAINAEGIQELYGVIVDAMESESGIIDQLSMVVNNIEKQKGLEDGLMSIYERLNSAKIELQDIAAEAQGRAEGVIISDEDLQILSEQIDSYNRVLSKHNLQNQQDLFRLKEELTAESASTDDLKHSIERLEKISNDQEVKLVALGSKLREVRTGSATSVEERMQDKLTMLKLEGTTFEFNLSASDAITEFGSDQVEIYFSPNKGSSPVPIHKAASGGELSRVMLALQELMSQKVQLKTVLFDEIDTGVSGDVAQRIGDALRLMGKKMQVIAITHLPQVAARGEDHYKVVKNEVDGRVQTAVAHLSNDARVEEIARLMSGDKINDAALENAKALMV
jgi:DNA repair protein RecN (Recombination protein N)